MALDIAGCVRGGGVPRSGKGHRRVWWPVCFLVSFGWGCGGRPQGDPVEAARWAVEAGDHETARDLLTPLDPAHPKYAPSRMLLGEIEYRAGNLPTALERFEEIPRDESSISLSAADAASQLAESLGCLSRAIDPLEYYVRHRPEDSAATDRLIRLLLATGLRRRADEHALRLARSGELEFERLVLLTELDRNPQDVSFLRQAAGQCPEDPLVNLGLAVAELDEGKNDAARSRLQMVVRRAPDQAVAQGMLGELLLETDPGAFALWHAALPEAVKTEPEVQFVLGLGLQTRGAAASAARHLLATLRTMPTHRRAMYQFGRAIAGIDAKVADAATVRARELLELSELLSGLLNSHGNDPDGILRVVELLRDSGRHIEARVWALRARDVVKEATSFHLLAAEIEAVPDWDSSRVVRAFDIAWRIDESRLPSADDAVLNVASQSPSPPSTDLATSGAKGIRFAERAESVGIRFRFDDGVPDDAQGIRMFQSTGGGVGVFDFDRDGRPDLLLTQGEPWPFESDIPAPVVELFDRLFLNLGVRFQEVTDQAAFGRDDGYGQGCSAGDFDNDGFPDLYVANIGRNRFLSNNGDGTFSDISDELDLIGESWTSSCLIADLNGDGHPDLFDVNYLTGERIHRIVCEETRCSPDAYVGAPDRVSLSTGDGGLLRFPLPEPEPLGKGLGIVALRVEDSPRLDLFVANDHAPNFFLRNSPADNAWNLSLTDIAYPCGLAVDRDGRQTACMGVAAGDVDDDGLVDLFVTNFKGEANNLYMQRSGGLFVDAVTGTGLLHPGIPYVGWGAQFVDVDADGDLDLIVANGHVADFRSREFESRMPTQIFEHLGGGRFRERTHHEAGEFFGKKLLGRSLATLDWNGDGRVDAALSSIDQAVALLTNATESTGRTLVVRLVARSSSRDAIGTNVRIHTDRRLRHAQLTAGDGYQCSNERVLRFSLLDGETVSKIEIDWPAGRRQTAELDSMDQSCLIVEGEAPLPIEPRIRRIDANGTP